MSVKQDRTYARTAQDIERKYAFGKTFAEMLGLINDTRDDVDKVESGLRDVNETTTNLKRDTESVTATVQDLTNKAEIEIDIDGVSIAVKKIETTTGYEFGADGLNISKSGSEIENKIDETGMYVTKNDVNVLVANNKGVEATDLHAKTFLKIGKNAGRSRFEDYGINRTACFWIGG